MPIIKSAVKRMRQTTKRRARNVATKRSFRSEIKELTEHIEKKDAKKAVESLKKVQSELDKAVKKNVLKKNTAARTKAQLAAKVKAIGGKAAPNTKKTASSAKTSKKVSADKKKAVAKKAPSKTSTKKSATKK